MDQKTKIPIMHQLLRTIFETKQVQEKDGSFLPLHSHTTSEQCEFLQELIKEVRPESSVEVGLAYGISTIAILDALDTSGKTFHHRVIDPFQEDWKDIGLLNIERAGFKDRVTFYRRFSDQVLPELYIQQQKIQFAYVDTTKVFDVLMTDVYFITKILQTGGILVLDDCGFPGIRMLVRYLSQHPSYQVYRGFQKDRPSGKKKLLGNVYHSLAALLPFKNRVFEGYNFKKAEELGVNYGCVAFKKIKEDDRHWDWHCEV
jgi:predicted O-methyltransferase YrrM